MEHDIRRARDPFGAYRARGWPKQREQLGRPAPDILMRLARRAADRCPPGARLRNGLVGAGLVLTPDREAGRFGQAVGHFDQPLFSSVCGSMTRTMPLLRFR